MPANEVVFTEALTCLEPDAPDIGLAVSPARSTRVLRLTVLAGGGIADERALLAEADISESFPGEAMRLGCRKCEVNEFSLLISMMSQHRANTAPRSTIAIVVLSIDLSLIECSAVNKRLNKRSTGRRPELEFNAASFVLPITCLETSTDHLMSADFVPPQSWQWLRRTILISPYILCLHSSGRRRV